MNDNDKSKRSDHLRPVGDVAVEVAKTSRRDAFNEKTLAWMLTLAARASLSHRAFRIGAVLAVSFCNRQRFKKTGALVAYPGQKRLAEHSGTKPRAVGAAISELKKAGIVRAKHRRRDSSVYELLPPELWQDTSEVTDLKPHQDMSEVTDLNAQGRRLLASRSATSCTKVGDFSLTTFLNTSLNTLNARAGRRAASSPALQGVDFAALPEEQASVLQAVVVDHFNGRLPPWLHETESGDALEAAMLDEKQLLLALAYERGRAADFPVTYQSFEDDVGALEMLLAANEGTHKVVAARLARKTRAEARRELFNLSDLDPLPELSEAECEAVERVANLCGVDLATQVLVHLAIMRSMQ